MAFVILRLLYTGILLASLCKAQSAGCAALLSCANQYGESIVLPSFGASLSLQEISTRLLDSICKHQALWKECFSQLKQCDVYSSVLLIINSADIEKGLELFCGHKSGSLLSNQFSSPGNLLSNQLLPPGSLLSNQSSSNLLSNQSSSNLHFNTKSSAETLHSKFVFYVFVGVLTLMFMMF